MRARTRDRVFLPFALPVGILLVLALVLFGFSRILLSLGAVPATATALVVAFSIVAVSAFVAGRPVIRASSLAAMVGAIAGVAMLAGGIALIAVSPPAEGGGGEGGPAAPSVEISAQNLQFSTKTIDLTAETPETIAFDNKDAGTQHNIAIYEDDTLTKVLFQGSLVTGPDTADYKVPGLPAGSYYFHCDVHPTMNGTVEVASGGGGQASGGASGASGSPAGGGGVQPSTVTASNLSFDTNTLTIPAGTATSLIFDNQDAGTAHNIAIYPSESDLSNPLFRGEVVTGPTTTTYQIPPLDPGSYFFHCDVHPTMTGTVTVR
jgi:plastocyanin